MWTWKQRLFYNLFFAVILIATLALGGMPPIYGEKMFENKLMLKGLSAERIEFIMKLPPLLTIECSTGRFGKDGLRRWTNNEMTVAWIYEIEGQCIQPVELLFDETGD